MSLNFTSGGTSKVAVSPAASINNLDVSTAFAWVFLDNITSTSSIFWKGLTGTGYHRLLFGSSGDVYSQREGSVTTGGAIAPVANFSHYGTGKWMFVAGVLDKNGVAADQMILIGDRDNLAAEPSSYTTQNVLDTPTDNSGQNLDIGNRNNDNRNFQGEIGFFGLWDVALSDAEIHAQQFHPHLTSGCVMFMHLGLHGATNVYDFSGNGNNGTGASVSVDNHVPLGPPYGFDNLIVGKGATLATVTDGLSMGEALSRIATLQGTIADGLNMGDALAKIATILGSSADGANIGDTSTVIADFQGTSVDGLTLGESLLATYLLLISDGVTIGDTGTVTANFTVTVSDAIQMAEVLSAIKTFGATVADGFTLGDISGILASGVANVTFTSKKAAVTFTIKIPEASFASKKPEVDFTVN